VNEVATRPDPGEKAKKIEERRKRLSKRMGEIKHKLVVLSGKGGVGKSTVAAYLATSLASRGMVVGLLDTDIHGPSIPKLLGLEAKGLTVQGDMVIPVSVSENLKVMSIAFLLRSKRDAVIWRGPLKMAMIEEFLANVDWGPLDYLIIDSPPGTGDEPLSVCQLIPGLDGAIVVATAQELALADVEKSITFCGQVRMPVAGVIENMSGLICPHCGKKIDVFKSGGAEDLARRMGVPFLGRLPLVPEVVEACDRGECSIDGIRNEALKQPLEEITAKILERTGSGSQPAAPPSEDGEPVAAKAQQSGEAGASTPGRMDTTIALPLDGDRLSTHFGHSSRFGIYDVKGSQIVAERFLTPPPHAPGVIPSWLKENGVEVVLASGLGRRAIAMFEEAGITVVTGASPESPRAVVEGYLAGNLVTGENVCDH
jgi:ATP-binding protein involved in chromosome partitioning